MDEMLAQKFIMFKKWKYRSQTLFKLRAVEVATSFHFISPR